MEDIFLGDHHGEDFQQHSTHSGVDSCEVDCEQSDNFMQILDLGTDTVRDTIGGNVARVMAREPHSQKVELSSSCSFSVLLFLWSNLLRTPCRP